MTRQVPVTLAVGDYDLTSPLITGEVSPQGVDLTVLTYPTPPRNWRMVRHLEFDVAEVSLASYVARFSRGIDDLIAIPVFPHRRFRHSYIFLSPDSAVCSPSELIGGRVGIRVWANTAAVWVRGILAEHYGMPLDRVQWVAQDPEDVPFDLAVPPAISVRPVPAGQLVTEMCCRGDLDALIYPELPRQILDGSKRLRRMFPDSKGVEQEYYTATGIFPIMHVICLRADLAARYPWLPRNILEAFTQAKQLAMRRLEDPRTVSLAWLHDLHEEERGILGPDPWQYGLGDANRHNLDTFLSYASADGVAARRTSPEELFHPASVEELPAYI